MILGASRHHHIIVNCDKKASSHNYCNKFSDRKNSQGQLLQINLFKKIPAKQKLNKNDIQKRNNDVSEITKIARAIKMHYSHNGRK